MCAACWACCSGFQGVDPNTGDVRHFFPFPAYLPGDLQDAALQMGVKLSTKSPYPDVNDLVPSTELGNPEGCWQPRTEEFMGNVR